MGFREQLIDKLKKKEGEIRGHENKIREARVYIQALQDMLRSLPDEGATPDGTSTTDNILRPGSMPHKTYELLVKARKPLHISVILKGIGEEPTRAEEGVSCQQPSDVCKEPTNIHPSATKHLWIDRHDRHSRPNR